MNDLMKKINAEMAERRQRCIGFDISFRASLPKKIAIAIFENLPEDANLERIEENFNAGIWTLYISSFKFEAVKPGMMCPRAAVKFELHDNGDVKNVNFIDAFEQPVHPRVKPNLVEN